MGIRKSLTNAAKDDFWKVRKAGFALLMAMVGDSKPIAFVEDTAVSPDRLPQFYDRFQGIVERHGVRAACYGHADVGCLHIRPIINVKTAAGVETVRSIAREISDLVIEFGGSMSGEHGDGLARSLWNRKLFGPEVYSALQAGQAGFRSPKGCSIPARSSATPDPGDHLRIGPSTIRAEPAPTIFDFSAQGGFAGPSRCARASAPAARRRPARCARATWSPATRCTTTRGRANALAVGHVRRAADERQRPGQRDPARGARPLPPVQGLQERVPVEVDMAKLKAEVLHQYYAGRSPAPGPRS